MNVRKYPNSPDSLKGPNRKRSAAASVVAQTLARAKGSKSYEPFIQIRFQMAELFVWKSSAILGANKATF